MKLSSSMYPPLPVASKVREDVSSEALCLQDVTKYIVNDSRLQTFSNNWKWEWVKKNIFKRLERGIEGEICVYM